MKEISLNKLYFKDFMGFKKFTFEPDGESCKVLGQNNSGKTTILTGFLWLLWGENANGDSQFDIKPRKSNGEVKHHLESTVEGEFEVEGETVILRKIYKEKWTKSRGSDEKTFDGHTKEHYVDDVPVKQSEYEEKLEEIFGDLGILRILVDPQKFNSMHWQSRREILMDLIEGVSTEDVIKANSDLEELDLDGKDPEERKKQLKSQQKKIDEKLDKIPVQINEHKRDEPEIDESKEEIEARIEELKEEKADLEEQIADIKSTGGKSELREKRSQLKEEAKEFEQDWKDEVRSGIEDYKNERSRLKDDLQDVKSKIADRKNEKQSKLDEKERLQRKRENLSGEWDDIQEEIEELEAKSFPEDEKVCSLCGQELPEDDIEEHRKEFNQDKAEKLKSLREQKDEIEEKGVEAKEKIEEIESGIPEIAESLKTLREEESQLESKIEKVEGRIEEKKSELDKFSEQDEYLELQDEIKDITSMIEAENSSEQLNEKKEELEAITDKIGLNNDRLSRLKSYQRSLDRIKELRAKEQELSASYEELEKQSRLVDKFIETKVNMVENSINEKFELVDFKLFKEYQNGKIKPTCEMLVDGVSADSTLNTGSKVKGNLDIIRVLSAENNLRAPVIIDRAESLTSNNMISMPNQIIRLVATEGIRELKVERE